jgi:hypothetical protein
MQKLSPALPLLIALSYVLCMSEQQVLAADKAKPTCDKVVDCLLIEQEDVKIGKMKLYLAQDCARLDAMNGLLHAVSTAPDWNVFCWNHDRQYFSMTKKQWHDTGIESLVTSKRKLFSDPRNPPQKVTFMGMPALKNSRLSHGGNGYVGSLFRSRTNEGKEVLKVTFIATSHLKLSRGAAAFCEGLFLTTPNSSVVLESQAQAAGKPATPWLTTKSITHVKKPTSFFTAPREGLKRGPSLAAVVAGKGIEEMMLNFSGSK